MKHKSKEFENLLKDISKKTDFKIERNGNKYTVKHTSGQMHIAHYGPNVFHPLRRWVKNVETRSR